MSWLVMDRSRGQQAGMRAAAATHVAPSSRLAGQLGPASKPYALAGTRGQGLCCASLPRLTGMLRWDLFGAQPPRQDRGAAKVLPLCCKLAQGRFGSRGARGILAQQRLIRLCLCTVRAATCSVRCCRFRGIQLLQHLLRVCRVAVKHLHGPAHANSVCGQAWNLPRQPPAGTARHPCCSRMQESETRRRCGQAAGSRRGGRRA